MHARAGSFPRFQRLLQDTVGMQAQAGSEKCPLGPNPRKKEGRDSYYTWICANLDIHPLLPRTAAVALNLASPTVTDK